MADTDRPRLARLDQAARRCVSGPYSGAFAVAESGNPHPRFGPRKRTWGAEPGPASAGIHAGGFDTSIWDARCRSASAHETMGCMCTKTPILWCTRALPYVVVCLAVAPRPPERRCRSGTCVRGRERPPLSACLDRHRAGSACARSCHPPQRGSLPTRDPSGKGVQRRYGAADHQFASRVQPGCPR